MPAMLRAALVLPLLTVGCATETTQIVVTVDTDMRVPDEVDEITLEVRVPEGRVTSTAVSLVDGPRLPVTLGLRPADDDPMPLTVIATARRRGSECVRQEARTAYVDGETRRLSLSLLRSCAFVTCPDGQTCTPSGCAPANVPGEGLPTWNGRPAAMGASCRASAVERCNHVDDDCDEGVDEGFDLANDPRNCGECDRACPEPPGTVATCTSGACDVTCRPGRADCNADPADGCEADVTRRERCGDCAFACEPAELCGLGFDERYGCVSTCPAGTMQCGDSCVGTSADAENCGGCGVTCGAQETCVDGRCRCAPGFADCDAAPGCEARVDRADACGGCDTPCAPDHALGLCTGTGECVVLSCSYGWADCDARADNGCETRLGTTQDCASCGDRCAVPFCSSLFLGVRACTPSCDGRVCNGDECVTSLDPRHCGGCGVECGPGQLCILDACMAPPAP